MIKIPRLKTNRHGVYCVRYYWRNAFGKLCETQHSLGTKDAHQARLMALQFNLDFECKRATMTDHKKALNNSYAQSLKEKYEEMFEQRENPLIRDAPKYELDLSRGIMKATDSEDHKNMMEAIEALKMAHGGQYPSIQSAMTQRPDVLALAVPVSRKISDLFEQYIKEKSNVASTLKERRRTVEAFIKVFNGIEINLITQTQAVHWKTTEQERKILPSRLNKRISHMKDLFSWAKRHAYYYHPTNPFDGLFVEENENDVESYESFDDDEMLRIFSSGYPKFMKKPDHYWIPLVCAFTGARREEVANLKSSEVLIADTVPCMEVFKGKTPEAHRRIPLLPKLLELGFMDYANAMKAVGHEYLFPYLVNGSNGRGKNAGRQFALWLDTKEVGINKPSKVLHSFRHSVVTAIHNPGIDTNHGLKLLGHKGQGVHFKTYAGGVELINLQTSLRGSLKYRDQDIFVKAVKLEDPTFKAFYANLELLKNKRAEKKALLDEVLKNKVKK